MRISWQNITDKKKQPYVICFFVAVLWVGFYGYFYEDFTKNYFYMPFLGIIAATVANTTPAAAGIVYFPILTRLSISPVTAVQYNLMIQAYGMSLGTYKWYLVNKKLFILNVIPVCLLGGSFGVFTGVVLLPVSNPELLTLIFNFIAFMFTQIIFFSILYKHTYPNLRIQLTLKNISILILFSFLGGLISGWIGFGIDTIFYFILTVVFRINPAAAIVTSISLMAGMSVLGTILNIIFHEVPVSLWYSALPGVTIAGLFLASYLAMRLGPKNVLLLFTILLSMDFFVSLWNQKTIPLSETVRVILTYLLVTYLLYIHVRVFRISYQQIGSNLGDFRPEEKSEPLPRERLKPTG